jgi:hypothetical protein
MRTIALLFGFILFNHYALATEGVKMSCTESSKHGLRKGSYSLPVSFLQNGDSISFGSYIHIAERYLITVTPPISDAEKQARGPRDVGTFGTYEILLTQLPTHETHPNDPEKVCHASSVVVSGNETKSLEIQYHRKDDINGFLPYTTKVQCDLSIINL